MRLVIMFLLLEFILFVPQKIFSQPTGALLAGKMDDTSKSPGPERPEAVQRIMQSSEQTTSPMTQPPLGATAPAAQFPGAAQDVQPPKSIQDAQTPKPAMEASGGTSASMGSTKASTKAGESAKDQPADQQSPFIEIKKLSAEANLYSLELRNVDLADLFRIIAHDYKLNILIDKNIKGTVTASLSNISLEEALDQIAQMHNIILEKQGNVILVKPRFITKIFILKNIDAHVILGEKQTGGAASGGGAQSSSGGSAASGGSSSGSSGSQSSGNSQGQSQASTIYNLLSPEGKVFLGDQPNSLMVIDYLANMGKIEAYLNMADQAAVNKKEVVSKVFKLKYISARDMVSEDASKKEDKKDSSSKTDKDASSTSKGEGASSAAGGSSSK